MGELWNGLSQPYALTAIVAALLLAIVVPLHVFTLFRLKAMAARLRKTEELLADGLTTLRLEMSLDRASAREEMNSNLRGMSDSVVRIMSEMSRTQQQQLDLFGGQIRAMNRADENRIDRMRVEIEEKLQEYDKQMTCLSRALDEKLTAHERRLADMRNTLEIEMSRLRLETERKLEQIRTTVAEKLDNTVDRRLDASFRIVAEQLEQVYKGLGEMQSPDTGAPGLCDLKQMLSAVKTQGAGEEAQLGALLEQALGSGRYERDVAIKPDTDDRVAYAVRLPGKGDEDEPVYLPIDARLPAEDCRRLAEEADAKDKRAAEIAGRNLEAVIRSEARRIRAKFIDPPATTDFAIMFLPVEGLYAKALGHGDIIERLQSDYRVIVAGPTTLLAMLGSLQMGFRTAAIARRSSEAWELLGVVKTEFGRFADLLSKTQQRLHLATASIEDAERKTRTIQRRLEDVQALSEPDARRPEGGMAAGGEE